MKPFKLKDLTISITDGKHGDCENQKNSGFYFISCKDVYDGRIHYENARQITEEDFYETHKRTQLEPNDILVTNSGTIGRMALVKDIPETRHTTFQKSVAIVKPNEKVVRPAYLYYALLCRIQQLVDQSNGAAQKNLLLGTMREFSLSIEPDLDRQGNIARTVSVYDDLIENNQKQIKLLEEAAQRLYKEWFIDLRFPGHESTPIVNGLPEGWQKKKTSEVCDTVGGGTPSTAKSEYFENGTIKWVTPTDLTKKNSLILLDTEKKITQAGLDNSSAKLLPPETILMTSRASIGYFAVCEYEVCTNQGFIACIPKEEDMRFYLLFNLMSRTDEIKGKATGSTFLEITKRAFRNMSIIVPEKHIMSVFDKYVSYNVSRMRVLEKENARLIMVRDRLLSKLMSGNLEVSK